MYLFDKQKFSVSALNYANGSYARILFVSLSLSLSPICLSFWVAMLFFYVKHLIDNQVFGVSTLFSLLVLWW